MIMNAKVSKKAVVSLLLGGVGFIPSPLSLVAFPMAIVFGTLALKDIDSSHEELRGRILGQLGRFFGIAGVILIIIAIIVPAGM